MNMHTLQRLDTCQRKQYKFGIPTPVFCGSFPLLVVYWDCGNMLCHYNDAKDTYACMKTFQFPCTPEVKYLTT